MTIDEAREVSRLRDLDEAHMILSCVESEPQYVWHLADALRAALAEVDRLRAERDEAFAAMSSDGAAACADNAILRAENERLRTTLTACKAVGTCRAPVVK